MFKKLKPRLSRDSTQLMYIPISSIYPNPAQPRKTFSKEDLAELSDRIRENGLIQPITVRKGDFPGKYFLVAGERRLRASAMAGFTDIPCIVSDTDDMQSSLIALVENLQRCDLDFFEEAMGIYNLIKTYGFSQESAAKKLGKSQSAVSNKLRLLRLPPEIIHDIVANSLSERHARALLRLPTQAAQEEVIKKIIKEGMTVSETDKYIDKYLVSPPAKQEPVKKKPPTYVFKDLRIFLNTINHAVDTMRTSGIAAKVEKEESEDLIRMTICIPKNVPRET